ncbi:uncharacterized protein [Panulirus ornatus]|uniref:uncharacterized protein n=1 Tax=Panulirus ornatus TaxID=150431 RepID=UPI003A8968F3
MRLFNLRVLVVLMVICLFVAFAHRDPQFRRERKRLKLRKYRKLMREMKRLLKEKRQEEQDALMYIQHDYPQPPTPVSDGSSNRNYLQNDILVQPIILMPGATLSPDVMENLEANQ